MRLFTKQDAPIFDSILNLEQNALFFGKNCIPLKNITKIWVGDIPKDELPFFPTMISLLGGVFFTTQTRTPLLIIVGIAMICLGLLLIYKFCTQKSFYALNIELNSGSVQRFFSEKKDFLDEVFDNLNNIIISGNNDSHLTINLKDANLTILNNSSIDNSTIESKINNRWTK